MVIILSKEELIQEVFGALNSYKRHRTLKDIKVNDKQYHEIQMYKMIDKIELGVRAINKEFRECKNEHTS